MYVHSERGLQTNLQVGDTTLTGLMYHPTNMTILPSVGGWKTIFSNLKIQLLSGFKLGCRGYNHRLKDIFKVETCWNSGFSHQLKGEKIEQLKLTVHLILGSQETMGFHALNEEPGLPGVTFPSNQFLEILDCLGYTWDIYIYYIHTYIYKMIYYIDMGVHQGIPQHVFFWSKNSDQLIPCWNDHMFLDDFALKKGSLSQPPI
jgi:hypothetical protein